MSLEDYRAGLLVNDKEDVADFMDKRPAAIVEAAERALGVDLPPSYRAFVSELGAGDIAGEEFLARGAHR